MTQTGDEVSEQKKTRRTQDNLDTRITLIPRAYSFALGCLFLSAMAVGLWAVFGSIPIKARGNGMIVLADQQVFAVQSENSGRIGKIAVATGDDVSAQDVLAELSQSDLEIRISVAREAVDDLETKFEALNERLTAEVTEHEETYEDLRALYSSSITEVDQGREKAAKFLADEEQLVKQGLATRSAVLGNLVSYQNAVVQLANLRIKLADAQQALADFKDKVAGRIDDSEEALDAKRRELEKLETMRTIDNTIRAPGAGRVEEIRVVLGQNVSATTVIMTLVHGGAGFEVIAFLKPDLARRVEIGMPAQVVPASVSKAEFGAIRGTVSSVSSAPVSKSDANNLLRDEQLAERMTSGGETYLARIGLAEDTTSASGFKWWSGGGPQFRIKAGTLAGVEIVLMERAPVTFVVPALRQLLGF